LAIAALCRAASVFDRPAWRQRAAEAFDFVMAHMSAPDGRVQHAWRLGRVTAAGLLDDQAAMARAAVALFEAEGEAYYLDQARRLVSGAEAWFADADGSFYSTAADAVDVPLGSAARPRTVIDSATPAANGVMAEVFARLHHFTGEPAWRARAERLIAAFSGLGDSLTAAPTLLAAADVLEAGTSVVVTGPPGDPGTESLVAGVLAAGDPGVCVLRTEPGTALPPTHPAYGKTVPAGVAIAYVCRGGVCSLPVAELTALNTLLRGRHVLPPA
jgi:uncharacterized protein YyaL (SSP411 family)